MSWEARQERVDRALRRLLGLATIGFACFAITVTCAILRLFA